MRIGIQRNVDKLGRVTIPIELREFYGFEAGKKVSIIDTDDGVLISNPKKKKEQEKAEWFKRISNNFQGKE